MQTGAREFAGAPDELDSRETHVSNADPPTAGDLEDGPPVAFLPRELLSHVFGLLDIADRSRASRACRRWRRAALDPPHCTQLSLRLRQQWAKEGDVALAWHEASWAPDPTALAGDAALGALRSPLAGHVGSVRVALGRAAGPPAPGDNCRRWPVRAFLQALPASARSLEIAQSEEAGPPSFEGYEDDQSVLFGELRGLQELAPQLRELVLRNEKREYGGQVPRHAGLERLDLGRLLLVGNECFLESLPSLRLCAALYARQADLPALAARGVRVRNLYIDCVDLAREGMVEAVSSVFQPGAFAGFSRAPARLAATLDRVPVEGLPATFAADAEEIAVHFLESLPRPILPWLKAVSRGPCLRFLEIQIPRTQHGVTPRELLAALRGCREGLRVSLDLPSAIDDPAWSAEAGIPTACELLLEDRALLRAVSVMPGIAFFPPHAPPHAGLAAVSRYRAEYFDALAEHHRLDEEEQQSVRRFLAFIDRSTLTLEAQPTEEARAELAMYSGLKRRARAHLGPTPA